MAVTVIEGVPEFFCEGAPVIVVKKGTESLLEPIYFREGAPLLVNDGSTQSGRFNALRYLA